jgi:DNA repair protein RadA/Sms
MAKAKLQYACTECGTVSPKWLGQCPSCQAWNTFVETIPTEAGPSRYAALAPTAEVQALGAVKARVMPREATGIGELDRVLGGGLVQGAVVLIGGDPGIGKSTLLLQTMARLAGRLPVLYVSGEESADQIALRAERLAIEAPAISVLAEIELSKIEAAIARHQPKVVVIDSIQTVYTHQLGSAPGSVGQVRECAAALTRLAKQTGVTVILVGHVTKEGSLAGPRVLEHIVDTVLYFEGDTHTSYRVIRAIKNRFGAVNELGVFAMTERGLREVTNPSALFLSQHARPVPGSCIMVTQEGTRPLLVELQALVDTSHGHPRRLTVGLDANRLAMLLAVLHRHAGIACHDQDVFLNAVGGVKVDEPGSDLAALLAITSSLSGRPLPEKLVVFGEVGLAGEVRPVQRGQERLREAAKLGFVRAIVPAANRPKGGIEGIEVTAVERLDEAIGAARQ